MAQRTCSIDGCDRPFYGRTWCEMHCARWGRHGDPLIAQSYIRVPPDRPCSIDGCDEVNNKRGWCTRHYDSWRRTGNPIPTVVRRTQFTGPKRCPDCGEVKPPADFHVSRQTRDGRNAYCRLCMITRARLSKGRRRALLL